MTLVVDVHGHMHGPAELHSHLGLLLAQRGAHRFLPLELSDQVLAGSAARTIAFMDRAGIDVQLVAPMSLPLMYTGLSESDTIEWFSLCNDVVAKVVAHAPRRLRGIGAIPHHLSESAWIAELERCVVELGFVGVVVNPDPLEGTAPYPRMGAERWYPVYEQLTRLGVPGLVHASRRLRRRQYLDQWFAESSLAVLAIAQSQVFASFPDLRLVVPHGGGSIPFQIGRWRAQRIKHFDSDIPLDESFIDSARRLWYDTAALSTAATRVLLKVLGPKCCLLGTEFPGEGMALRMTDRHLQTAFDPTPQRSAIDELEEGDRARVLGGTAIELFQIDNRDVAPPKQARQS